MIYLTCFKLSYTTKLETPKRNKTGYFQGKQNWILPVETKLDTPQGNKTGNSLGKQNETLPRETKLDTP